MQTVDLKNCTADAYGALCRRLQADLRLILSVTTPGTKRLAQATLIQDYAAIWTETPQAAIGSNNWYSLAGNTSERQSDEPPPCSKDRTGNR